MIHSFRDLTVWQKAIELAVKIYRISETFPRSEQFGLTAQMRRAAVSIPSNIAEGKAAGGQNYPRHLRIALGSEAELHTQVEIGRQLGMIGETDAGPLLQDVTEVGRLLSALLKAIGP